MLIDLADLWLVTFAADLDSFGLAFNPMGFIGKEASHQREPDGKEWG